MRKVIANFAAPARRRIVLLAGLAVLLAGPARAQDAAKEVAKKAQLCAACHGENGVPIDDKTPVIWGQQEGYLYLQLRDFKSGARKNEIMTPLAQELSRDDMMALAAFFSQKPWANLGQPPAPSDVTAKAARANNSIACTGCHQGQYQGEGTQPRLAGQRREYLERTMLEFRDGTRGNNPGMTDLMKAASKDDLVAMAQYLAGLQYTLGQ